MGKDFKFINEPLSAWFIWLGAMLLFLIAWHTVIKGGAAVVHSVTENV